MADNDGWLPPTGSSASAAPDQDGWLPPTGNKVSAVAQTPIPTTDNPPEPSLAEKAFNTIPGAPFLKGAGKGVLDTTSGIGSLIQEGGNAISPGLGDKIIPPSGLDAEKSAAQTHGWQEGVGKFAENVGEFAAGEEGLKALGSVAKIAHYSPEMIDLLEKYPKATKAIMGLLKPATVGAAQGAVKGAGTDEGAVKGAEAGAIGGAAGGVVAYGAGALSNAVGKATGLGTTSFEDAMRSAKPSKWNTQFVKDWETAAPRLQKVLENGGDFKDFNDASGRIREAANDIWTDEVKPIITNHSAEVVNTDPIYDAIRNKATKSMQKFNPDGAKALDTLASNYDPSKILTVADLESDLEHLNAEMKGSGFYSKPSEEQAAMLKTDPQIAGWDAAANSLREQLYKHLTKQGENIEELKDAYGAMSNIAKTVKGQVNVAGRQAPMSLKTIIGLTAGIAHGGPTGIAAAAIPIFDKLYNEPTALLNRAISKSAGPGVVRQAAQAVRDVAKTATKAAGGAIANTPASGPDTNSWVRVQASNGKAYFVHPEDLDEAKKRDPGLKETQSGSSDQMSVAGR